MYYFNSSSCKFKFNWEKKYVFLKMEKLFCKGIYQELSDELEKIWVIPRKKLDKREVK